MTLLLSHFLLCRRLISIILDEFIIIVIFSFFLSYHHCLLAFLHLFSINNVNDALLLERDTFQLWEMFESLPEHACLTRPLSFSMYFVVFF